MYYDVILKWCYTIQWLWPPGIWTIFGIIEHFSENNRKTWYKNLPTNSLIMYFDTIENFFFKLHGILLQVSWFVRQQISSTQVYDILLKLRHGFVRKIQLYYMMYTLIQIDIRAVWFISRHYADSITFIQLRYGTQELYSRTYLSDFEF